jgi:hypothetical protein
MTISDDIKAALERIRNPQRLLPTVVIPPWIIERYKAKHGEQWEAAIRDDLGNTAGIEVHMMQ